MSEATNVPTSFTGADDWTPPPPPVIKRPQTQIPPTTDIKAPPPVTQTTRMSPPLEKTAVDLGPPSSATMAPPRPPRAPGIAPAPQVGRAPGRPPVAPGRAPAGAAAPASRAQQAATPRANYPSLRDLVQEAFDNGYSDIHLGVGETPRFRDRGQMMASNHPVTTTEMFYDWLRESLPESQVRQFEESLELDTAVQYEGLTRCRVNCFVSLLGPAMVLRLIPIKILTLEQLRAPDVLRRISEEHKGMVLITGPTGSGKSTTLAAMIDYLNTNFPKHIISIEDPIEFVHKSKKSMIRQREVGIHTLEFANALKASLREDPDVILIGEMRDRETVDTAIKAAQTGHLVFGTLHTNSAVKTIERLLGIYKPEEQPPMRMQLAETLVGIVAQTLVRTTDGKRAAAHEIMKNTDAIRDYIHRGAVDEIEELIQGDSFEGMQTMNQALFGLYQEGRITEETAMSASPRPNEMAQWLRGRI